MSTVTENLAKIDTKISTILDNPDDIASYKIGQKSVNKAEILAALLKAREIYQKLAEKEPYEDIRAFAYEIDDFGIDTSELIGDSSV